mmetsp:Transcript_2472/g.5893  ORF Transcript_2472/g.5893 Transcript_2472/m.5893 type:complete len:253 (+) Transcript_2472:321-1079(+)
MRLLVNDLQEIAHLLAEPVNLVLQILPAAAPLGRMTVDLHVPVLALIAIVIRERPLERVPSPVTIPLRTLAILMVRLSGQVSLRPPVLCCCLLSFLVEVIGNVFLVHLRHHDSLRYLLTPCLHLFVVVCHVSSELIGPRRSICFHDSPPQGPTSPSPTPVSWLPMIPHVSRHVRSCERGNLLTQQPVLVGDFHVPCSPHARPVRLGWENSILDKIMSLHDDDRVKLGIVFIRLYCMLEIQQLFSFLLEIRPR